MQQKLNQSGKPQLTFDGDLLAETESGNHDATRWFQLRLFRSKDNLILGIACLTRWQGEKNRYSVLHAPELAGLLSKLEEFDPLQQVGYWPPGEHYAEKERNTRLALQSDFAAALSELWEEAGLSVEFDPTGGD